MRRLSKSKKGKSTANEDSKETGLDSQEVEMQGNGKPAPSDDDEEEEIVVEKKSSQNQKKSNKRGRKSASAKNDEADNDQISDEDIPLGSTARKGKRARKSNANAGEDTDEKGIKKEVNDAKANEEEYEVEKVVDCRMHGGSKQFKVRWKGYDEANDTWESEADLNCPLIIKEFLAEHPDAFEKSPKVAVKSGGKKKPNKEKNSPQPKTKKSIVEPVSEEGGEKVYEVERVVEVHFKKNGQREFLIRWKGFGSEDDTWEPESNLNCKELIEKFMEKVNKAKELTVRELRANPQVTNRFTLNTRDSGRRLSSRHTSRQRATYYNAE